MDMWADDGQGQLRHYLSIPMEKQYRVEHLVFVPTQRILVGACSDLSLCVFTDTPPGDDRVSPRHLPCFWSLHALLPRDQRAADQKHGPHCLLGLLDVPSDPPGAGESAGLKRLLPA